MITCTPFYNVNYNGAYYKAGEKFEILPSDVGEMKQHGAIDGDSTPAVSEEAPKKRGRKKSSED